MKVRFRKKCFGLIKVSPDENTIEYDDSINGYVVKYRCPSCGRKYKVTLEKPTNRNIRCNYCKYMVKIRMEQNAIRVS